MPDEFLTDAADADSSTRDAIMEATYRALCEHGYAGTSISRIAEEFEKSKSLLYYHYEDKDELLADFLSYLLDRFEAELRQDDPTDPYDRLQGTIEKLTPTALDDERNQFFQALVEMRAQTPHKPSYRDQFERTDELVIGELIDAIEAGVEAGKFADVNAHQTAVFIHATLFGTLERSVTTGDVEAIRETREELERYLQTRLLNDQ